MKLYDCYFNYMGNDFVAHVQRPDAFIESVSFDGPLASPIDLPDENYLLAALTYARIKYDFTEQMDECDNCAANYG